MTAGYIHTCTHTYITVYIHRNRNIVDVCVYVWSVTQQRMHSFLELILIGADFTSPSICIILVWCYVLIWRLWRVNLFLQRGPQKTGTCSMLTACETATTKAESSKFFFFTLLQNVCDCVTALQERALCWCVFKKRITQWSSLPSNVLVSANLFRPLVSN